MLDIGVDIAFSFFRAGVHEKNPTNGFIGISSPKSYSDRVSENFRTVCHSPFSLLQSEKLTLRCSSCCDYNRVLNDCRVLEQNVRDYDGLVRKLINVRIDTVKLASAAF